MDYKIVVDSSCELPKEYKDDERFESIPFGLEIEGEHFVDDKNFDREYFLRRVAESSTVAKSSCPSPDRFRESFVEGGADRIYVVTLSSKLSGTYESALLGKSIFESDNDNSKQLYVVDSEAASCAETQIAIKAMELEEEGWSFDVIVDKLNKFRDELNCLFVLDNLDTLRKNGRLTGIKSIAASTLRIKPLMAAEGGNIVQLSQSLGIRKAINKLVDAIVERAENAKEKYLMISHCNALDRANTVKELVAERVEFKKVIILETDGLSSMYTNEGGVIVAF